MPLIKTSIIKPTGPQAQVAQQCLESLKSRPSDVASIDFDNGLGFKIPEFALKMLLEIFEEVAKGNAVTLIPVHSELTTQQAADILNVSRPYVVKLLENNEMPHVKRGRHRRIRFDDLMTYKEKSEQEVEEALDEMVRLSQELGIGYE